MLLYDKLNKIMSIIQNILLNAPKQILYLQHILEIGNIIKYNVCVFVNRYIDRYIERNTTIVNNYIVFDLYIYKNNLTLVS